MVYQLWKGSPNLGDSPGEMATSNPEYFWMWSNRGKTGNGYNKIKHLRWQNSLWRPGFRLKDLQAGFKDGLKHMRVRFQASFNVVTQHWILLRSRLAYSSSYIIFSSTTNFTVKMKICVALLHSNSFQPK